ncbi:hypothetical protein WA588_004980, partial [Blastocystis sp. NMH]
WYVLFFFNCALPNYHYIVTPPISPIPLLQRQQYHHLILQPTSSPIPTELPLLHQNTTITPSTYPNEYSSVEVTNSPVTITPSNTSSDQYHIHPTTQTPRKRPIIINPTPHRTFPNTSFVVADAGIVFYVYAPNHCAQKLRYLNEIGSTTHYVKTLNSTTNIAVVTNCNIPHELYDSIDVLYHIDEGDVPNINGSQWYTRMLYNAYPPFRLNYVLDSHVFPCDSAAAYDLFTQFNNSYVDIAIGNRVNRPGYYMGGGILYRANERTKVFWKRVYELMIEKNNPDDQFGIQSIMMGYHNNYPFNYRVLSFNWLFAS